MITDYAQTKVCSCKYAGKNYLKPEAADFDLIIN